MPKLEKIFAFEMRHLDDDEGWLKLVNNTLQEFAQDIAEEMNDPGCG